MLRRIVVAAATAMLLAAPLIMLGLVRDSDMLLLLGGGTFTLGGILMATALGLHYYASAVSETGTQLDPTHGSIGGAIWLGGGLGVGIFAIVNAIRGSARAALILAAIAIVVTLIGGYRWRHRAEPPRH